MSNLVSRPNFAAVVTAIVLVIMAAGVTPAGARGADRFEGKFYSGQGDVPYLRLLDVSRRMFSPDPEYQNIAMLYTPAWNGLVEGPTWGAWWIQNSYGPTYCGLPLFEEPLATFLQNAQDLWFDQMGDGRRTWKHGQQELIVPDGQLCDAAAPNWFIPKQGDGNVAIHDWGIEFTAAGLVMQAELLLIERDEKAIDRYLPLLRRCANFIESRRDPQNDLFLAGPAGNLLAPSYAGWKKPDGTYDKAYLAGLSITYIAALDRLIELEKLAGDPETVKLYTERRELAGKGLPLLTTEEGYFVKYVDPDGTPHGVYGAEKYGYFEAVANHDAICMRVADDTQAEKIYQKIASIPGLRPHDLIITNCPGLDDMYTPPTDWLWQFGTWVNGGHWSTCEARMVMSYYRLGKYDDARRSMQQLMKFADEFRMDNPLVNFGARVYQPNQPINLCYDSFGPPAAMIRGLFEYLYRADALVLRPHIPPGITQLEQHFPIRFGANRLYLATTGSGVITAVLVNGQPWRKFDETSITLPYDETPREAVIQVALGGATPAPFVPRKSDAASALPDVPELSKREPLAPALTEIDPQIARIRYFHQKLVSAGLADSYEAAHARLAVEFLAATCDRLKLLSEGKLKRLSDPSQAAADKSYFSTTSKLCEGLEKTVAGYKDSEDVHKKRVYEIWNEPARATASFSSEEAQAHQQAWAKHLGLPVQMTNTLGMKLSLIPPGAFMMGSPPEEEWHRDDETLHRVVLTKPFYMGTTEVTQRQWTVLMGDNPSFCTGDALPVETVTWEQAVEFCRKLSHKERAQYRLPTEAEWEYACRAGTTMPFHTGETISTDQANYDGNYTYAGGQKGLFRETTIESGSLAPNAWGLHELHGNVWEWCGDWYGAYPEGEVNDPTGPAQGEKRVIRGGTWINFPAVCRSANRGQTVPVSWNFHFGFRVVRVLD